MTEVLLGVVFLILSLVVTYYANVYTVTHASREVTDLMLDSIPVMNVDFIFTEGVTIFTVIMALIVLYEPKRIPFTLKSITLFSLIRAAFMVLTHLAAPADHSYLDTSDVLFKLSMGDDLFFSMHTGLPFMFVFVFWEERYLRFLFLAFTVIGGAAVLLGHIHYSIDVFSALFIAFGIFHIAKRVFRHDYERLMSAAHS